MLPGMHKVDDVLVYRLVSYIQPAQNEELVKALQKKKMTVLGMLLAFKTCSNLAILAAMSRLYQGFIDLDDDTSLSAAMDCIPRTVSRAQTYDSLSSMANIAGYR